MLKEPRQIAKFDRPLDVPDTGLYCDLLWSDPGNHDEKWRDSERGVSFTFNAEVVEEFCDKCDIDLICRGHLVVDEGYEFFADKKLVTIFSAPKYTGDFNNSGCFLSVKDDLSCRFLTLKQSEYTPDPELVKIVWVSASDSIAQDQIYNTVLQQFKNERQDSDHMVLYKLPIKTNGGTFDVEIRVQKRRNLTAGERHELYEGVRGMIVQYDFHERARLNYRCMPKLQFISR